MNIGGILDSYSRQARLYPALLTLFPAILTIAAWFPAILAANWATALVTVAAACGFLYVLSVISRSRGKRHEKRLLSLWGGWPTTIWLRHSSGKVQPRTLARYHTFLGEGSGVSFPTEKYEKRDPGSSDLAYASAVKWLQEQCRGGAFALVDKENAEYGFRRNMRGMRWIGVGVSLLALAAAGFATIIGALGSPAFVAELASAPPAVYGAMAVNIIAILGWAVVVTDEWVLVSRFGNF